MLDQAFGFVDTVTSTVGEENWRWQGAMTKIGGVKRDGLFYRELSGTTPHLVSKSARRRIGQRSGAGSLRL